MTPKFPLLRIINLIWFPRRNQLKNKGLVVEPSTTPMNGRIIWLRRHETIIPKYHRVLQTKVDPSFLLTKGT
jgi:hypothetical protein